MTHWKKNIDTRYISGEDLVDGFNGLSKEMVVRLVRFIDGETFDQKKQAKEIRTILFFADSAGKELHKGVVLNKTNAKFFVKEMESPEMEDWNKKPVVMYAHQDPRHGFVVRFRRYEKPVLKKNSQEWTGALAYVKAGNSPEKITGKYQVSETLLKELSDEYSKAVNATPAKDGGKKDS